MHNEHYTFSKLEPWAVVDAWGLNYYQGNILKYICRMGRKAGEDPVKDAEKVVAYAQKLLEVTQKDQEPATGLDLQALLDQIWPKAHQPQECPDCCTITLTFADSETSETFHASSIRDLLRGFVQVLEQAGYSRYCVEDAVIALGTELHDPLI